MAAITASIAAGFDWYSMVQFILTAAMLCLCFERSKTVPKTIYCFLGCLAGIVVTVALNNALQAAGRIPIRTSYYGYICLLVFWSMLFSGLTRKVSWKQGLLTILFFLGNFLVVAAISGIIKGGLPGLADRLTSCLIMVILLFFYRKVTTPITMPLSHRYWIMMLLVPVVLIVLVDFFSFANGMPSILAAAVVTLFLDLLIYLLFMQVVREIDRQTRLAIENQNLVFQTRQMEDMQAMMENTRKARHELKNNYFYIETLIRAGKEDEVLNYIHTVIEPSFARAEMVSTGNHFVDMVLSQKNDEARQQNIPIIQNVRLPEKINMNQQMLCSLLFNLFDNAIEASRKVTSPDIYFEMTEVKGYLRIEIRNRIEHSVLAHNPQLHTSKKDARNHGIGMGLIRQIVRHYDGTLDVLEENGYFVVRIMLADRPD